MNSTQKRLERLERKVTPKSKGALVVHYNYETYSVFAGKPPYEGGPTPERERRRLAEAHERAGPNGTVLIVVFEGETERADHDETN